MGWSLVGVIWGLALVGACFEAIFGVRMPHLSTRLHVAMGWLVVVAVVPLLRVVRARAVGGLLAGGLLYTGGVVFLVLDCRLRFAHAIWRRFVLAGSTAHFRAALGYAMPRPGA